MHLKVLRMCEKFDFEEAKKFLLQREKKEKEERECERELLLQKAIHWLKREFQGTNVTAYLVGSILRKFSGRSDIDVVLQNFTGDRFSIWTRMQQDLGRDVEIILFESCGFQQDVLANGLKVI